MSSPELPGIVLSGIPRLGQEAARALEGLPSEVLNQPLPCFFFFNQCDFSAVRLLLTIWNILSQESAFSLQPSLLGLFRGSFSKTGQSLAVPHRGRENSVPPQTPTRPEPTLQGLHSLYKERTRSKAITTSGGGHRGPPSLTFLFVL